MQPAIFNHLKAVESSESEFITQNATFEERVAFMSGSYEIIGKIIDNWKNDSAWERSFDQEKLTAVDVKLDSHEAFASESFD